MQKSLKCLDDRHCKWLSVTENSGEYRIRRGERRTVLAPTAIAESAQEEDD